MWESMADSFQISARSGSRDGAARRTMRSAAALLLLLDLGCAHVPPPAISPLAHAQTLEARSLHDPHLREFIAEALSSSGLEPRQPWDLTTLSLAALYYH